MASDLLLLWATAAVSLFNTVILLWLGLTVLLNAERRDGGVWLAGLGLLAGGAFFVAHTAMLDYDYPALLRGIRTWWYFGWAAIIGLPCGWYGLMLWYAGFWEEPQQSLRKRHRLLVPMMILTGAVIFSVVVAVSPFRLISDVVQWPEIGQVTTPVWMLARLSWLVGLYPLYLLLCLLLSLDALRRPHLSVRVLRDVAHRRARPWLVASTIVQLAVSLMMGGAILLLAIAAFDLRWSNLNIQLGLWLLVGELLVCIGIGIAVILLGKAIVSYEIFTNKALPRRGFLQQWRYVVLVSAAFGLILGGCLTYNLRPIYTSLVTTVLMTTFLALWSWRAYREHEVHIAGLRPLVASQGLYEHVLAADSGFAPGDAPEAGQSAFESLCRDVLEMSPGFLFPLGALSSLVGAPLRYPAGAPLPTIDDLQPQLGQFRGTCWEIEAPKYCGAIWAVPLWSERGLVGLLLLGPKNDGSLYTQEEIEIARSSGERIIDARAGTVMAQRLMALQRRHLAESQVLDRRARRALHDDVLPRVHTAILTLSALEVVDENLKAEALAQLADAHRQVSNLLREMPLSPMPQIQRSGFIGTLQHAFETEWKGAFDSVQWNIDPAFEECAQRLHPLTAEVLFYAIREAIRNAVRYGRGEQPDRALNLGVAATCDSALGFRIEDDGVGFQPREAGESAAKRMESEAARSSGGTGRGLQLHSTMMAIVGGTLTVESQPGRGTCVVLALPQNSVIGE